MPGLGRPDLSWTDFMQQKQRPAVAYGALLSHPKQWSITKGPTKTLVHGSWLIGKKPFCTLINGQSRSTFQQQPTVHNCSVRNRRTISIGQWTVVWMCFWGPGTSFILLGKPGDQFVCAFQNLNPWKLLYYIIISIIFYSQNLMMRTSYRNLQPT
jgi:hypothetical protein